MDDIAGGSSTSAGARPCRLTSPSWIPALSLPSHSQSPATAVTLRLPPLPLVRAERDTMRTVTFLASLVRRVALIGLLLVALGACVSETSATSQTSRRSPFQVDQPFPDLALPALEDGRPASIRDYRGQKVILHVFASW